MALPKWIQEQPSLFLAKIKVGTSNIEVIFNLYNSKYSNDVVYRDNCVATPVDVIVDCDLKLVDDLIDDFKIIEISGTDGGRNQRNTFRKYVLAWILSHELGHIALRHGVSDFGEGTDGERVFDFAKQQKELEADAYAIKVIGNLTTGPVPAYQTILDITNALIRKSLCPETFPKYCSKIPLGGVGLYFDYTSTAEPIRIPLSGTHPAYVARFLRILYLSGVGTSANSINYLAREAIDHLAVENDTDQWITLKKALTPP